jgi:hypothetical protein
MLFVLVAISNYKFRDITPLEPCLPQHLPISGTIKLRRSLIPRAFHHRLVRSMSCIPANPDISGIGVRVAIYAQNILFAFAPVISTLRDSKVTRDELEPIEDQSASTLTIAFALLLSTIIQAKTGILSSFHTAIVLNLSWMNNTSMIIWFLLYAHQKTRSTTSDRASIPATWSGWLQATTSLIFKQRKNGAERVGDVNARDLEYTGKNLPAREGARELKEESVMKRLQKKSVLVLGSLHLSLMASIGIWLWSNPSGFGTPSPSDAGPCPIPSYSILGSHIPLTSPALRIVSLVIYAVLLIPGINLVVPLFFFISIHILYNKVHTRLSIHIAGDPDHNKPNTNKSSSRKLAHIAMLNASFLFLFAFNVVFALDVEVMLSRNRHLQEVGEDEWGFGQVLALLLLAVPLLAFLSSLSKIQEHEKEQRDRAQQELKEAQTKFNELFTLARQDNSTTGHDWKHWIEHGADPNTSCKLVTSPLSHSDIHPLDNCS